MNSTDIAAELRKMSGGGLITLAEVSRFVRDKNKASIFKGFISLSAVSPSKSCLGVMTFAKSRETAPTSGNIQYIP